jgi:lactate permease
MLAFLSLSPLLILFILLVWFRWPILMAGLAAGFWALMIAVGVWQMLPAAVLVGGLRAMVLGVEIGILLLGAIVFFKVLEMVGVITVLKRLLIGVSPDSRIQLIMIAWFLSSFLEGTAGFGIPAVIVAPLLVAIGFRPLTSILLALVANSTAVIFGAVGTPVTVGLAGYDQLAILQTAVPAVSLVGVLVPTLLLWVAARTYQQSFSRFVVPMLPLSLVAGLSFVVPFWLISFWHYEFASIGGALIGALLMVLLLRVQWLLPQRVITVSGDVSKSDDAIKGVLRESVPTKANSKDYLALAPYLLFSLLLLLAKVALPTLTWGLEGGLVVLRAFNPGLVFLLTAVLTGWWYKTSLSKTLSLVSESGRKAVKIGATIFVLAFIAQLLVESGQNNSNLVSMLHFALINLQTPLLPFIAPVIGALGAFVVGSITVSNILFAPLQVNLAAQSGHLASGILALQLIGSTAGNMISLANVAAVRVVVRAKQSEGEIMGRLLPWAGLYLLAITLVGAWFVS